jgi:hypothetical protein
MSKLEDGILILFTNRMLEADETISGVITIAHEVTNQVISG